MSSLQVQDPRSGPCLALLLLLFACKSGGNDSLEFAETQSGSSLQVSAARQGEDLTVTFTAKTGELSIDVAKLSGVNLAIERGGARRDQLLPFVEIEREENALQLHCRPSLGHEVSVRIERESTGDLRVLLLDQVGVRSTLLELSLNYEFLREAPIDESSTPHLHPGEFELAGDLAFQAPVAFLRAGSRSLALSPDLELLLQQRRLPQGLVVSRKPASIRHGLMAQAQEVPDGPFGRRVFTSADAEGVQVRAETLSFGHFLQIDAAASQHKTLAAAQSQVWRRYMSADLKRSAAPMEERTWEQICAAYLDRILAENWQEVDLGEIAAGALKDASSGIEARFDSEEQLLRLAFVMASRASRDSQPELQDYARRILDLVLAAPRRAGLIPARFASSVDATRNTWELGSTEASSALGHHGLDSAVSGYWMLKTAELLPERRADSLEACRKLAYFFLLNQHSNGAIPVWYGREFLEPLEDPKWAADTAGPAMFLAEYASQTKDERVLAAARKAIDFLEVEALAKAVWPAPIRAPGESPGLVDPRSGNNTRNPFLLCLAARACLILIDASGDPSLLDRADDFLSAISFHQQVWTPGWMPGQQQGGLSRGNDAVIWGDPVEALAAGVYLRGYELLGRGEWLERGAAALRAGLTADDAGWSPEASKPESLLWGKSAAIAMVEEVRASLGQGVVQIAKQDSQGLDALWFEDLTVIEGEISFRVLSHAEFQQPASITFRDFPPDFESFLLTVNGVELGEFTSQQLRAGLDLVPELVASIEFLPPTQISMDQTWVPSARLRGPLSPEAKVTAEISTARGVLQSIDLIESEQGILRGTEGVLVSGLAAGAELRARIIHQEGARLSTVPPTGFRSIRLGSMDRLDSGDDAEIALVGDDGSTVVRFADGRENARRIAGEQSLTYALPVGAQSTNVDLEFLLTGRVRISTDDLLLHEDGEDLQGIHAVRLKLSDPRLWRDGNLPLTFSVPASSPDPVNLAHILYRSQGETASVAELGEGRSLRNPDSVIDILILPLSLADAPIRADKQVLNQIFFGGPQYRLTPGPETRMTAGSVRTLLQNMSGGLSEIRGRTLDVQRSQLLSSSLSADPGTAGELLAKSATQSLAEMGLQDPDLDLLFIVHSGVLGPQRITLPAGAEGRSLPCILVPERSVDGSLLSSGQALLELVDSLYDLHDLRDPQNGNFGELALSAEGRGHVPSGLAGVNLIRAGWSDQLRIKPPQNRSTRNANSRSRRQLQLSSLQEGRTLYRIPFDSLPDRGDLLLESRAMSHAEPGLPGSGCIIYWEFEGRRPFVKIQDSSTLAHFLRLSPITPTPRTPFTPGNEGDLFRSAASLDGDSAPSLATIHGELLWAIRDLQSSDDGRANLRLDYLGVELMNLGSSRWFSMRFDRPQPLPLGGQSQGLGSVTKHDSGFRMIMRPTRGAGIRGEFLVPASDDPRRLFVRVRKQGPGSGNMSFLIDAEERIVTRIPIGPKEILAQIDLSPSLNRHSLQIDLVGDGGEWTAELDRLLLVPRAIPRQQVRLPGRQDSNVLLMDSVRYGETHSMTASDDGKDELVVPLLLPPGNSAMRICLGFEADAPAETIAQLSAHLRTEDATWDALVLEDLSLPRDHGRQALHTAIIEIPGPERESVAFLTLTLKAPPGTKIHFVNLAIDRS